MRSFWKLIDSRKAFEDKILSIHHNEYHFSKLDESMVFTAITLNDWVMIVPITKEGKFIIAKQFRAGTDKVVLEFPGGAIDRNEDPDTAAKRELLEETGATFKDIFKASTIEPNPALLSNQCHIYIATGCVIEHKQNLDKFEDIELEVYSRDELEDMIRSGEFHQGISLAAYSLYLLHASCK